MTAASGKYSKHRQLDTDNSALNEIMEMGSMIGEQGCHLTWPELLSLTNRDYTLSWRVIKDRFVDYTVVPSYYCTMTNLKGFVCYKLENNLEAERIFRGLLEVDNQNICALGNLAVLCYRESRLADHREYVERLRSVIAKKDIRIRARAYYDRAHTIRHFEQDKRRFTYIRFIKQAVDISKDLDMTEKSEWLFDFGLTLYRKDCQLTLGNAAESALETGFRDAVKCFHGVIKSDGYIGNKALSWVFLGILLQNKPGRKFEKSFPSETEWLGLTALDCFNEALKLQPNHAIVQRRVGAEMTKLKEFDKAEALLADSLEQEESWFAYRHRGLLNLSRYQESLSKSTETRYLKMAQRDFKAAMKQKGVHADHSDLGYVMYLLTDYRGALNQFSCAIRSNNDDNFNPVVTHQRWATCLRAIGETTGALQQEEKAREVEAMLVKQAVDIGVAFHGHGQTCQGYECDLERFNYSSEDRPGYVNILSEESYPLSPIGQHVSFRSKSHAKYMYDFFVSFAHIDNKWTLLFFRKLEREMNLKGCIRYRDYECGNAIATNISRSIRESAKILIIVSPDSLVDPWCRYEVQKALAESLARSTVTVIPIMLRMCRLPEELELMTYIKCQDGQLAYNDWTRLRNSLGKNKH